MYTNCIKLEESSFGEIKSISTFLRQKGPRYHDDDIYSRVYNPIMVRTNIDNPSEAYEELIFMLLEHPLAYQICVNRPGGRWLKRYKYLRGILQSDEFIKLLSETASKDRFKDNFLEVKFKENPEVLERRNDFDRAIMSFREFGEDIIGYQIRVPYLLSGMFDVKTSKEYIFNYGLWVPDDYDRKG